MCLKNIVFGKITNSTNRYSYMCMLIKYFIQSINTSLSGFAEKSEVVWRLSADKQNIRKNSHTIHTPIVCFWSYVSLADIQNVRENESCLWQSKWKRVSNWKSWVYIVKPCQVIGSKHTVYFVQDKIKGADIVGGINRVTSPTNRFSKIISLPTSIIFVSRTSESVSYFVEFSCITAI